MCLSLALAWECHKRMPVTGYVGTRKHASMLACLPAYVRTQQAGHIQTVKVMVEVGGRAGGGRSEWGRAGQPGEKVCQQDPVLSWITTHRPGPVGHAWAAQSCSSVFAGAARSSSKGLLRLAPE